MIAGTLLRTHKPVGAAPASAATLLVLALAAFFSSACDPGHAVTYDNRTDGAITILIDGQVEASLRSMEKKTFGLIEFSHATFEARDATGRVLYRETLTWAELKERGWKIIITEAAQSGGSPTPTPTAPTPPAP